MHKTELPHVHWDSRRMAINMKVPMKLLVFDDSGSGKSTLAKWLISERSPSSPDNSIADLSLDHITWNPTVISTT